MSNNVQTLFNVASVATNVLSDAYEGSVFEYSEVCHNALIATVEDRLTHNDVTVNILKVATNVYTAHYLMSVALMTNLGNVNVRQVLDRLNVHRNVVSNGKDAIDKWVAVESYLGYPQFHGFGISTSQALESRGLKNALEAILPEGKPDDGEESGNDPEYGSRPGARNGQTLDGRTTLAQDAPNLAVGKIFNVEITNDGKTAVIPARITVNPITCNQAMFTAMYAEANQQNTWMNRFRRWRDGELSTIADMIFVNDVISEKAKILKADKKGIVKQLEARRRANKLSTLITQKTSIATASTITIMSKETANAVALAVGGRIDNPKVRAEIFNKAGLVIMAIVDEGYETVTMYYRGQAHGSELTYNECKFAAKGEGPNVMEVLRAFQSGQAPNL